MEGQRTQQQWSKAVGRGSNSGKSREKWENQGIITAIQPVYLQKMDLIGFYFLAVLDRSIHVFLSSHHFFLAISYPPPLHPPVSCSTTASTPLSTPLHSSTCGKLFATAHISLLDDLPLSPYFLSIFLMQELTRYSQLFIPASAGLLWNSLPASVFSTSYDRRIECVR